MEPLDQAKLSDRELLLILHNEISHMGKDVGEMKTDTSGRLVALETKIESLETHKADRTELTKVIEATAAQGRQTARLTNYLWFAFGALAIIQIAIQIYPSLKPH